VSWVAASTLILGAALAAGFAWYERTHPSARVIALVATHDTEFAASLADRIVLLGQGVVIADGSPHDVLAGGRHFSTEVARVTGGAALLPEEGARVLAKPHAEVTP